MKILIIKDLVDLRKGNIDSEIPNNATVIATGVRILVKRVSYLLW